MQECLHCGTKNRSRAHYCQMCGEALGLRPEKLGDPPVLAYKPPVELQNEFKLSAAKARRFLMLLGAMVLTPLGLMAGGWAGRIASPSSGGQMALMVTLGGVLYVCLVYGYMMGKTSESCGAPFAMNFMLGCIPPLSPMLWARLGGRQAWLPYTNLAIDALVLWVGGYFFQELPLMLLALLFVMLPIILYHLFGCATGQLAGALGLSPTVLTLWLCLVPDLLLIFVLRDMLYVIDLGNPRQPFALTLAQFRVFITPDELFAFNGFKLSVFVYLLVTVAGWVKLVYENLRMPLT